MPGFVALQQKKAKNAANAAKRKAAAVEKRAEKAAALKAQTAPQDTGLKEQAPKNILHTTCSKKHQSDKLDPEGYAGASPDEEKTPALPKKRPKVSYFFNHVNLCSIFDGYRPPMKILFQRKEQRQPWTSWMCCGCLNQKSLSHPLQNLQRKNPRKKRYIMVAFLIHFLVYFPS